MNIRKGFRKIVVDDVTYQYAVSLRARKCIIYSDSGRQEIPLPTVLGDYDFSKEWRGKGKAGCWSSGAVARLIKDTVASRGNNLIPNNKYTPQDSDIDSTQPYMYRYPSTCCIAFLASRKKLIDSMQKSSRKQILESDWLSELHKFLRQEGGMGL